MTGLHISGKLLVRNVLLNLIGQAAPLLIGVVSIPLIVRWLGTERFGLLSLAWVVLGSFAFFDFGLGRATSKYVAEALGKGEPDRIPQLVWTAVTIQGLFGFIGALVLLPITPLFVERILSIPSELVGEATGAFYVLALSVPVILVSSSLSGVLEGAQRFDLVNAVRIPSIALTFLLPLLGAMWGFQLPGIVALILVSRLVTLSALVVFDLQVFPDLKNFSASFALLPHLLAFGGWLTVTNMVSPIFVYLDRFLIGSLMTMSAVAYYTAPYELVMRLLIIPTSIASVLFPASSSLASRGARDELNVIVARSTKYLVTAMVPPTVVFLMFANEILRIWLGHDFAIESAGVFRLLSLAVLLNAIGYIPFALIHGVGRPDVVAKYLLIELPLYVGVAFVLISRFGINGAALTWCLRMVWTIPIFSVICTKMAGVHLRAFSENGTVRSLAVALGVIGASASFALWGHGGIALVGLLAGVLLISYTILVWYVTFDALDRALATKLISRALELLGEYRVVSSILGYLRGSRF